MVNNTKEKDDLLNTNNKIINVPTYKINGKDRRKAKKELADLKSFVKYFWREHSMEKDMDSIYGHNSCMSDENAKAIYDSKCEEILKMENLLSEPFLPIYREDRFRKLLD